MNKIDSVMIGNFKEATRDEDEHMMFYMSEDDVKVWYILIHGLKGQEDEFEGGEYIVRMRASDGFPYTPPEFMFMTPNGLYEVGTEKICVSIGKYHSDQYSGALGMRGFAVNLVSGLIGWRDMGHGIAIMNTKVDQKRKFARESAEYNDTKHADIKQKILESYANYSQERRKRQQRLVSVEAPRRQRPTRPNN